MQPFVEVRSLSKSYWQGETAIPVLADVQLSLAAGETLAILGQSGSGKSTLLSLLAGLDAPDAGEIVIGDHRVTSLGEHELARFRAETMGIVFQQFHLLSHLTAVENCGLPLQIKKSPRAQEKAKGASAQVGLGHRAKHFPHQLSGGERQRVAIARAFVAQPALLLADEPSGNLDSATGTQVMGLLWDLVSAFSTTLILVTHNEELAQRCTRRLRLLSGQLLEEATL